MQIHRIGNSPTNRPAEATFTGDVSISGYFQRSAPSRMAGATVAFAPGARTPWKVNPAGQTLIVTSGVGWAQGEGEEIIEIRAGDTIWCPPGQRHWDGATPDEAMTYVALHEGGGPVRRQGDRRGIPEGAAARLTPASCRSGAASSTTSTSTSPTTAGRSFLGAQRPPSQQRYSAGGGSSARARANGDPGCHDPRGWRCGETPARRGPDHAAGRWSVARARARVAASACASRADAVGVPASAAVLGEPLHVVPGNPEGLPWNRAVVDTARRGDCRSGGVAGAPAVGSAVGSSVGPRRRVGTDRRNCGRGVGAGTSSCHQHRSSGGKPDQRPVLPSFSTAWLSASRSGIRRCRLLV